MSLSFSFFNWEAVFGDARAQKKPASSFAIWRNLGKVPKNFFQTFPLEFLMNIMAFVCFP